MTIKIAILSFKERENIMELKGQVILDDETMDKLKEQIREEVINDIKENGNYSSEIEEYMNDCNFEYYIKMIEHTIDNVIKNTNKEDIHFESGWKAWNRLMTLKSLFSI